jgi:hypothetical protein
MVSPISRASRTEVNERSRAGPCVPLGEKFIPRVNLVLGEMGPPQVSQARKLSGLLRIRAAQWLASQSVTLLAQSKHCAE